MGDDRAVSEADPDGRRGCSFLFDSGGTLTGVFMEEDVNGRHGSPPPQGSDRQYEEDTG